MKVTLLPDIESVFADPAEAGRYLLPLATIDASSAHPQLSGRLHFVTPIDTYSGVVGESTSAFYSETCKLNWLGFRVVDGRYVLDTDYQFFEQRYFEDHPVPDSIHESVRDDWVQNLNEHCARTASEYEQVLALYRAGELTEDDLGFLITLGGLPGDENWANMGSNFALEFVDGEDQWTKHPYPLTSDGRRYEYIGSIKSDYRGASRFLQCETLLFYDAPTERALFTFDWT